MGDTHQRHTMLVVVAHPDDESFGCGSVIALAASDGMDVVVCCATRGEAGDASDAMVDPAGLGAVRERELHRAAAHLGAGIVEVLAFADSGWDGPTPAHALIDHIDAATDAVRDLLLRHRPSIVVTLDPTGSDGHRDHAAIGAATTAAFRSTVHWPASLYHWCLPRSLMARWAAVMAGADPTSVYLETELGRDDRHITTVIDTSDVLVARRKAIAEHASQRSPFEDLPEDLALAFLTADHLVRVVPPFVEHETERALRMETTTTWRTR